MADIPTVSWDETLPTNDEVRSYGDDRIRELKTQLREIIEVDHEMESSGNDTDWGYHNKVTLSEVSSPVAISGVFTMYNYDGKVYSKNGTDNAMELMDGAGFTGGIIKEIKMWYGALADIPTGWLLCDGDNGTPNLLAKFLAGIATDETEPGTTGGANSKTLITDNLPVHTHTVSFLDASATHTHPAYYVIYTESNASAFAGAKTCPSTVTSGANPLESGSGGAHTHSVTLNSTGSATAFDNRPVYYEVAYITRLT